MNDHDVAELLAAAERGDAAAVRAAIERGVSPVARDRDRWAAVHFAAARGHEDVARVVLDASAANVNEPDRTGASPLHLAARGDHAGVVRLLVLRGADTSATSLRAGADDVWRGHVRNGPPRGRRRRLPAVERRRRRAVVPRR